MHARGLVLTRISQGVHCTWMVSSAPYHVYSSICSDMNKAATRSPILEKVRASFASLFHQSPLPILIFDPPVALQLRMKMPAGMAKIEEADARSAARR
jgi:hypothetical protein